MKQRILAILIALALFVSVFAGCGDSGNSSEPAPSSQAPVSSTAPSSTPESSTPDDTAAVSTGPADTSEHYDFTLYYNYTGWNKQFGMDQYSKYLCDKFNISINWYGPDADPDAKLNLMVSSGDMPDAVAMSRTPLLQKIARGGYFQDLSQYMYPGNTFEQDVSVSVRDMLKIDGTLYVIPNWPRTSATGGNEQWIVNTAAWEAAGSPKLETLEDIHQFALKVKELGLSAYTGQEMFPLGFTEGNNGSQVYRPFYRATGMPNLVQNYFTQENGVIQYALESENFVKALREANKWYREGLFNATTYTDTREQLTEKLTNGRFAVMYYQFSRDLEDQYRKIVRDNSENAVSYEVLGHENGPFPDSPQFPVMDGVEFAYGDESPAVGWNVNVITTKAADPQRIFDLFSYMLTYEGSVYMMYGPEGGNMLDHIDPETRLPVLKKAESEFSIEEKNATGYWFWSQPAQATYVDGIKFALNNALPVEQREWTVDVQANLCSYNEENPQVGQKFLSDENTGITDGIDPQSDLGVAYQSLNDQSALLLPQILMAKDDAEFDNLVDTLLKFAKTNGRSDEICKAFQEKHDANVATQGYSAYSEEYDVYHLKQ